MTIEGALLLIAIVVIVIWIMAKKEKNQELSNTPGTEEYKKLHTEDGQIKCPHCNSTQIQMVPRKWSATTGIFTNKVDRVCIS